MTTTLSIRNLTVYTIPSRFLHGFGIKRYSVIKQTKVCHSFSTLHIFNYICGSKHLQHIVFCIFQQKTV